MPGGVVGLPARMVHMRWSRWSAHRAYTGWMTAKEQLQQLVADLGEEQASRALSVLRPFLEAVAGDQQAPRLPRFVGIGDSGRSDLSERVDELLAEGFGR